VPYRHPVRIRYGECDMQKVVFNANYLAYIDDATDTWKRQVLGSFEATGFDFMVRRSRSSGSQRPASARCSTSSCR